MTDGIATAYSKRNVIHSRLLKTRVEEVWQKNSAKYMPPDAFFGIQILQNSISAGALP